MFKSLQTFADSVADGANKLAEQARDGLHSAAEAAAALDAQLKAATSAPGTPNAKEKKGEGDAGSGWTTRETSPARSLNPPSPVKLGRSSVEAAAASVPETARHASGPSLADLQMENSTLRDQLHETLGQFAALQKSHDETAGKFKETAAQLDLVKQKARVKLASLTKEVEDLKKKNAELSSKDETSSSPVDDLEKEKSRASDAERRAEEAEEKVRQIEEKAREAEERALQVEEQLREAEGKARQAEEQTSVLEQRLLDQQRATSEETESLRSRIQVLETELSEARQMQASQLVDSEGAQASAARIVELEGQVTLNAEDLEKERNRADDAENKILEAEAKAREAAEEAREMEQRLLASSSALEQRLLDQQQASVEEAESLRSRIEALEAELSEARLQSTRSVDSDSEGAQAVAAKIAELEARAASLAEDLEKERNLVVDAENKAREAEDRLLDLQRASTVEAELLRSRIEALEAESSEVRQMQSTQSMELDSEGAQAAAARIAELETRSASLAEDLKKERSLVIDAESKAREVEERLVVQQRDSSEEIEALRSRIGTLENELSEARQTHSVQSMDLSSEGAQAMNVRITELESQAALLVEELARERNRAADAENKALEIEERLVSSAATSEEKRLQTSEELESLRLRVEALEAELSEARNAQMRSADVSTTDELTTKIAELEERNSSLLRDLEQAAVDADSSKDDNAVRDLESRANRAEELENALREATTRIEELEEALRGVKANQKDMELSNAQEGQNAQLETPQKEREELEGRLSAGEKVIRELEQRLEQAQRHAEDLAQRVQDIDSQKRNELEVSRGELEAALARAGELQAELEERDRIAAERRHMADTLEDDLAEAQKTVAEKEAGLERTGIRIQELERELELARAAGVPAEPPPSYEGPDPRELEKEVSDLKRLVEELRQQPPPPTAAEDVIESSPAVDAADLERLRMDMEEALKAKEADWEEERNALEEAAREAVRRVENLERELEETKRAVSEAEAAAAAAAAAPVPIPVELTARLKELEDRNFTLEEQARDFSLQIKTRTDTIAKQQEQHAALKAEVDRAKGEWEEKFKKMRNILAQANKNIAETREKLGVAEKEKERLAALVQTKEEAEVQSEAERSSLRADIDRLERELDDEREMRDNMLADLENRNRQLQSELTMARSEFQKYKVKAAAALQQNSSASLEARIAELEEAKARLERERAQHRNELEAVQGQAAVAESELASSLDRIEFLESRIRALEALGKDAGVARQEMESLKQTVELEKGRIDEAVRLRDAEWESKVSAARVDLETKLNDAVQAIRQREEETSSLRSISEALSAQLTVARDEVAALKKELDETKRSAAAWAVAAAGHQRAAAEESGGLFSPSSAAPLSPFGAPASLRDGPSRRGQPGSSLQDLLVRRDSLDSASSSGYAGVSAAKEKEFAAKLSHMAELLNESEEQITRLLEQERVLKEEIRNLDRSGKRANMNIEYLKNVVLKFLENPSERQQLVMVLTNILQLSPSEASRLKSTLSDSLTSIGSSLGLW